jgi:GTP-binding protein
MHLVDGSEGDLKALKARIQVLNRELKRFSPELAEKRQLIVLNKVDARPDLDEISKKLAKSLKSEVLVISGVSGQGLDRLADRLLHIVAHGGNEGPETP